MNYYDEIASGYEELHKEEQFNKLGIINNHLRISSKTTMLDVGCGPGWASEFFDCVFVGVDPSQRLLDIGLNKGINLIRASAEQLPFDDESFDVVISVTAVQNFDDINKGIEEIKRVSKKDIVITTLKDSPKIHDIEMKIREELLVMDVIENEHDLFFFCHKR